MSSNHCKIKHRNAYVKVGINGKDLEVFRLKIKDMMPEYEGKLVFCYVDQDGDRILIRNQENFEIFLAENENSKLEIVEDEIPVKRKSESAIDLCSKKLKTDIKIADHSQDFNEVDKSAGLSQDIDKLDENIRTKSDFDGKKHIKKVLRNAKKKSVKPKQGNLDSIETGLQRVSQQNDDTHKSNVKDKADEKSIRDINYLGILNNNLPMLEVKPNLDTKIQEKPSTTSQQLNDNPFLKILDYSKDLYVLSFPFSDNSLITEQILLPTSPTPFKLINYEPVNFLFLISQLIIHLSTKVGLRKTCNFFKIPVDLCLFIRNDIQNTNQSQIKGFYDIFNYLADKDSYKTCKVTPNFCGKIVNDLESQTVSYDQVICDLEVSCFTLDMWLEIFKSRTLLKTLDDPYPDVFRFTMVCQYLEGLETANGLWSQYRIAPDMLIRWAHYYEDVANVPLVNHKPDKRGGDMRKDKFSLELPSEIEELAKNTNKYLKHGLSFKATSYELLKAYKTITTD